MSNHPTDVEETQPTFHGLTRGQLRAYIIILVALFIACVFVTIYHKQIFDHSTTTRVSITNSQFLPQTIDVKAGTDVTWTNNDSQPHQVAADPFPKDNSIPGFNNTVVLQPHDSITFRFDTAGSYTYHDESNPYQLKGTVIVR